MKRFFFSICFSLASLIGFSQILNIDKTDTSDYVKKPVFNLNFGSGLELDKQKITVYDATNSLDISLQKSRELFIFSSGERLTYNGPTDILNVGFLHLRFRHDYKNKIHPETFIQYQWDNGRGIIYRRLAGQNIRWNNYLHRKLNFIVATGIMYEQEDWNYHAVPDNKIPAIPYPVKTDYLKSNSYFKFEYKLSEQSDLFFTTFYQFRPDSFYKYPRIANYIKLSVAAAKHFNVEFGFSSVYDTRPVVPIDHFYFSISNTLVFKI